MVVRPIGAFITAGPEPWQVLQRDDDGRATLTVEGEWTGNAGFRPQVRIARHADQTSLPGCDWQDAEVVDKGRWRASLRPPTGGLYQLETRLWHPTDSFGTGDKIPHLAVGDVWVIAGQSNAVGYGHGPVHDPPALGVSVFGGDESWRLATHPIFDPTNTKHPANRDGGWVDVSPWLAFGKRILERTGTPVGLVPTALGGSPLSAWDPGSGSAPLYENMCDMIDRAGGRAAGMVWYQGESDAADLELASTYLERFGRFIDAFRKRYGEGIPVITAQLNRVFATSYPFSVGWGIVKEAQRTAARTLPQVAVVPTTDLDLSDIIHTSAVGNVTLGERFALCALGMVYGEALPWRCVDVEGARILESRTEIELRFSNDTGQLTSISEEAGAFEVEDGSGRVPVVSGRVTGPRTVVLGLGRPIEGSARCSHASAPTAATTLRDGLRRPTLSFHGVRV